VRQHDHMLPSTPRRTDAKSKKAVQRPDHIVVVIFENKHRSNVIGSAQAPYLNKLAAKGASMTHSYGVAHPSQPNYLALFSGSTHGVTSNACPKHF
jgi:phosphatidylinositol-3-phosphatase